MFAQLRRQLAPALLEGGPAASLLAVPVGELVGDHVASQGPRPLRDDEFGVIVEFVDFGVQVLG
jgi:hypothetical protein